RQSSNPNHRLRKAFRIPIKLTILVQLYRIHRTNCRVGNHSFGNLSYSRGKRTSTQQGSDATTYPKTPNGSGPHARQCLLPKVKERTVSFLVPSADIRCGKHNIVNQPNQRSPKAWSHNVPHDTQADIHNSP